jgi:hypothetical protein
MIGENNNKIPETIEAKTTGRPSSDRYSPS